MKTRYWDTQPILFISIKGSFQNCLRDCETIEQREHFKNAKNNFGMEIIMGIKMEIAEASAGKIRETARAKSG